MQKRIFLSTPISNYLDRNTGIMESRVGKSINYVYEFLGRDNLFLAIDAEDWGRILIDEKECTVRDFNEMKKADYMVVLIFSRISEGVLIELGWASSMKIPITIITEKSVQLSKLVKGLSYITNCTIYKIDWDSELEKLDFILKEVQDKVTREVC